MNRIGPGCCCGGCPCIPCEAIPDEVTVTVAGLTGTTTPPDCDCYIWNGAYLLTRVSNPSLGVCRWELYYQTDAFDVCGCGDPVDVDVVLEIVCPDPPDGSNRIVSFSISVNSGACATFEAVQTVSVSCPLYAILDNTSISATSCDGSDTSAATVTVSA